MKLIVFQPDLQDKLEDFLQLICKSRGQTFDPAGRQSDIRNIENVYQRDGGDFWMLESAGSVVGTIALKTIDRNEGIGEIKRFFVLPTSQGQGFGQRLMSHAIDVAASQGLQKLRLDTVKSATAALSVFAKHGFYEIEKYDDNEVAEIFMEKDLGARPSMQSE
jgi:N-acetylglutamate synthase-like GNAT family acetyltransferase